MVAAAVIGHLPAEPILGAVFAGGESCRFGRDKALAMLAGRPLLAHVVDRMRPQVEALVISGPARKGFPIPAVADERPGQGPLAGLCTILRWADARKFGLVATFACDTPFIPLDCVATLRGAIHAADCAVASGGGRLQPTLALWRTAARPRLELVLASGVRSLRGAIGVMDSVRVDLGANGGPADNPFFNINRPEDMVVAQAWLESVGQNSVS